MHPAGSVILFTVLSGLGFGAMALIGLGAAPAGPMGLAVSVLALGLGAIGLTASTFHLGNPQRAWRALSQWRSSWLSREGVVSIALMIAFFAFTLDWWARGAPSPSLGALAAALAVLAVICTAMIYGQLRTVPRWSNPFTPAMFLGAAAAGGALLVGLAHAFAGEAPPRGLGLVLLLGSAMVYAYRRRAMTITLKEAGSTPETATGLGHLGRVRMVEPPHSAPNYLMKEMVFRVGRKHAEKLALLATLFGLFAPLFLFILAKGAAPLLGLALLLHVAGMLAFRWLFFAEAAHSVGLYYGRR